MLAPSGPTSSSWLSMFALTGKPTCARIVGNLLSMPVIPLETWIFSNEYIVHLERSLFAPRCNDSAKAIQPKCNSVIR